MNEHPSENMPENKNTPTENENAQAGDAASLDEQLVAYLDGELDAETIRRIEARLASDAEVRRRLQSLEHTWELLDDLDAAPIGEPFTRTTLEMVAVAAGEDFERSRIEAPRRRRRRRLQILGVFAAAAALGFLGVWRFTPDPNRRLVENLPVLESFEEYRQTGNIAFLRQLRDTTHATRQRRELRSRRGKRGPVKRQKDAKARAFALCGKWGGGGVH